MTTKDVIDILRKKQGQRTAKALAADLGISEAYLSDLKKGKRSPGPMILDALGLEHCYKQKDKRRIA